MRILPCTSCQQTYGIDFSRLYCPAYFPQLEYLLWTTFFLHCSSERVFDNLVDYMIGHELALKASVENAELLLFTSVELPLVYWSKHKFLLLLSSIYKFLYALKHHILDSSQIVQIPLLVLSNDIICRIPKQILSVGSVQGKAA